MDHPEQLKGDDVMTAKVKRHVELLLQIFAEERELANPAHQKTLARMRVVLADTAAAMGWR